MDDNTELEAYIEREKKRQLERFVENTERWMTDYSNN